MPQHTFAQIPAACADEESLENLRCCPATADGVCGEDADQGECVELNIEGYSRNTTNVRDNWPHYFTHVSYAHKVPFIYSHYIILCTYVLQIPISVHAFTKSIWL